MNRICNQRRIIWKIKQLWKDSLRSLDFTIGLLSKLNLTMWKNHFSSDLNTVITFRLEYKSLLVSVGSYFKLSYR
jgi:hypothetical protein